MTDCSRVERLLGQALEEVRDGIDAIPIVSAALTALRVEAGELGTDALDGYPFPDEAPNCICPPDLLERGGFRGGCPEHSALASQA